VFAGNLPAIAQLPNASHGGVVDKPVAKMAGSGQPLKIKPPQIVPPSEPIPFPKMNKEQLATRAERRRAEAEERRKKRKAKKGNKKKK
jgi:hypothetical protein